MYLSDFSGVIAASTLGRLYDRSREVAIFGNHPPGDFMDQLLDPHIERQ
jgi:hypothetical protein